MKTIKITKSGNYLYHGIKNEMGGYSGTADNRLSYKAGIMKEFSKLPMGTEFQIVINEKPAKNGAIFKKENGNETDLELLNY